MWTGSAESVTDIYNEPLSLNPEVTTEDKPLISTNWIAAGITRIREICYEVIPGCLPVWAIHDMRTDNSPTEELRELFLAAPPQWS